MSKHLVQERKKQFNIMAMLVARGNTSGTYTEAQAQEILRNMEIKAAK